jgi:dTDP-4-dehydrorhamnose 3,5-epimerase
MKMIYDNRGWFLPLPNNTNVSFSKKGVFRGLHAQTNKPQGKQLHLLSGRITDFFVSPSGNIGSIDLVAGDSFFIQPGFLHGFYAIEDSMLLYVCDQPYNPESEIGLRWTYVMDLLPDISYEHPFEPILSEKDKAWPKELKHVSR